MMDNRVNKTLLGSENMSEERNQNEKGIAIILALFFVLIAVGLVSSGVILMKSNTDLSELRFRRENQAKQFARSGLTEALSWFRRQTAQPVTDFAPALDASATPKIMDTDDPNIGLVREFEIEDGVWGRYEVWREDETDTDSTRLEFRRKYQAKDLSAERGFSASGSVWLMRSVGYVFERKSTTAAWNQKPNRVLAVSTIESEVQRLSLQLPGAAAINIQRGPNATINTKGRVRGGTTGAGIYYPSSTPKPITGPKKDNRVTGSPAVSAGGTYDDSVKAIFGVSRDELRSMADLVITDPDDFPDPIPENAIIFVEASVLKFDAARSLNGTGLVFVEGSVTMISGNNSFFTGMLYIDGNMTMRETSDIYGAVVVTGNMTVQGSGDYATIYYDGDALSQLNSRIGQYRWSGAFRSVVNNE